MCWLFVRDRRPGDGNNANEGIKPTEVGGIGRVQRKALGNGSGGDHQVDRPASWFTACGDDGCGHAAVDAGCGLAVFRSDLPVLASSGDEPFYVTISDNMATFLPSLSSRCPGYAR